MGDGRTGADAFLNSHPTRAERLRYVVGRLASEKGSRAASATKSLPVLRRSSLDKALLEQEAGGPTGMTTRRGQRVVAQLTASKQTSYRKRAKSAGVVLRADALLGTDYVVVRNPSRAEQAAMTRPASPYKERAAQQ